jgi:hypothetical protein
MLEISSDGIRFPGNNQIWDAGASSGEEKQLELIMKFW